MELSFTRNYSEKYTLIRLLLLRFISEWRVNCLVNYGEVIVVKGKILVLVFFVILLVPLFVESYYFCRGMPDGLYCDGNTPVECMDEFANYGDDCGLCWCHSGTCDCEQTCEDGGLFSGTNIRCPTYVEQEGKWGCDAYYDDNRCCPNNQYAVDHGYYLACDASGGDCSPQGDQVLLYLIQSTEMFPLIYVFQKQ